MELHVGSCTGQKWPSLFIVLKLNHIKIQLFVEKTTNCNFIAAERLCLEPTILFSKDKAWLCIAT